MGDVGDALSGLAGGIGSALSGVGQAFSGQGGGLGSAVSSMLGGSAAPGQTTDPSQEFTQSVDPTGTVAASEAINPPGQAPTAPQNQQGGQNAPGGQMPGPGQKWTAPTRDELVDLLKSSIAKGGNPYQAGGGAGGGGGGGGGGNPPPAGGGQGPKSVPEGPIQDPLMPNPLDAAAQIDTSGVPPRQPGSSGLGLAPGQNPAEADAQGPLARNPRAAAAGQGAVSGATQGGQAPAAPELSPAGAGGIPALASAIARGSPLGVAGAVMSPTPAETGELPPTPANIPPDQRNMPYPGQQYRPDPSLPTDQPTPPGTTSGGPGTPTPTPPAVGDKGQMPKPPVQQGADDATQPATKAEYEKWLKQQGVSPSEAKKRADDSNLPTKKPADGERPYHMDGAPQRGVSNITRDRMGMQGVPPMLGELAQMVMPLLGGLLSGGMGGGRGRFRGFPFGRGGHGRFGGRFMGGHPGGHGSGMWPYHHPGMGWRGFGFHPGGGWRPLDPKYMASMGGQVGGNALGYGGGGMDGGGGTGNPQLDQILQALGIAPQGQGGGFQQGGRFGGRPGQGGGGGGSGGYSGPPSSTPGRGPNGQPLPYTGQQADQFTRQVAQSLGINPDQASRVLQAESAYGQNYSNPRDPGAGSHGPFQLDIAPGALGQAFMQATGEDPRDPNTWKDQIVYALRYAQTKGWGPWTTAQRMGFGRQPAGQAGKQFAWNYGSGGGGGQPGTVQTGDSKGPNPDGTPLVQRDFSGNPLTVAQQ
jgi:hypothetical protein